ncbi:MAG: ATPase [Coxiella sp. RIFCSPHIGHO2_12_FULL_42_15]|nr:MAG: ATPase [Coxiella sp. RIFCSPHIGHO2_12_FULL_42_15]
MLASIRLIEARLIEDIQTRHYRYLYPAFSVDARLNGLIGQRGVGKTTLMLQYLKNHPEIRAKAIYFSADHIYFSKLTLYEFVENLYLTAGTTLFFIDEIHKYANWNQELKNLYDGFPSIKIVFSGSSSLELIKGTYDLSRRALLSYLRGMSFREYLNFTTDLSIHPVKYEELLTEKHTLQKQLAGVERLKGLFQDYLKRGFYPFSIEGPEHFEERLLRVIEKTIFEDIANFYHLKTENLPLFKKILSFLASIPPGNVTIHNIAKNISVNDRTIAGYLQILQETGLIQMIYPYDGGNAILRKPEKIFLNNTNLCYALQTGFGKDIEVGTIRELMFIQTIIATNKKIYFSKTGDYRINDAIFEIGGPNKTRKKIQSEKNSYLIKDNLISTSKGEIPLIYFGFLY